MSLALVFNGASGNETPTSNESFSPQDMDSLIASYPSGAFTLMGVYVSVIGLLGFVANGTVLVIFSRYALLSFQVFALCRSVVIQVQASPLSAGQHVHHELGR